MVPNLVFSFFACDFGGLAAFGVAALPVPFFAFACLLSLSADILSSPFESWDE